MQSFLVSNTNEAMKIAINNPFDYNETVETHLGVGYNVRVGDARIRYNNPEAVAAMLREDYEMPVVE